VVKGLARDCDKPCYSGRYVVLIFSGEKKWRAIRKWRSRSLMGKVLSCGSSRWKICWWTRDQWIAVDPGTAPTGTSADDWKNLDQKAKSTI
jgi:hypothetical protein